MFLSDHCKSSRADSPASPFCFLLPTSINEITYIIDSLKCKYSAGLDEMSLNIFKLCSEELSGPLLHMTNLSLPKCTIPIKMKASNFVPLHKNGSNEVIENCRPISLIWTFLKILEKVVLKQIFRHLSNNNFLTEAQHGFLPKKSTQTALVNLVENIIDSLEEENNATEIFVYLRKAFDCLSHEPILYKLNSLGILDYVHQWFRNYLSGHIRSPTSLYKIKFTANS